MPAVIPQPLQQLRNDDFSGTVLVRSIADDLVPGQAGLRQPIIGLNCGRFTKAIAPRLRDRSGYGAIANRMPADGAGIEPFDALPTGLAQHVGLFVSLRVIDQVTEGTDIVGLKRLYSPADSNSAAALAAHSASL